MLVLEEEAPQEGGLDGSAMIEDKVSLRSDVAVSSTVVSPELIPIPAPVRASVHTQQALKGCGTKDQPYDLDFTPTVRRGRGVPPETHRERRNH